MDSQSLQIQNKDKNKETLVPLICSGPIVCLLKHHTHPRRMYDFYLSDNEKLFLGDENNVNYLVLFRIHCVMYRIVRLNPLNLDN